MSSTLTPRHGSWAPCFIHIFLVCSVPNFLSSAMISLAVIYILPHVACHAQSALRLAFGGRRANARRRVDIPLTPLYRVSSLRLSADRRRSDQHVDLWERGNPGQSRKSAKRPASGSVWESNTQRILLRKWPFRP